MASSLSAFLGEIGRHQLLTPEQELMLGRKVQAMVVLHERCTMAGGVGDACDYNDIEKRTMRVGERAKDQMITANLRLVVDSPGFEPGPVHPEPHHSHPCECE